jgi:hypothetical protein
MEYFIFGMVVGYYILYPIQQAINKGFSESHKSTCCAGNCNQGRKCTCVPKD